MNRFIAFMCYCFFPIFGKMAYKKMRARPIVPRPLLKCSELTNDTGFQLVAHRGLSGDNPENTAPSFEAAAKHGGYYGLECDTHMTKDGVWVIMHDPNVETIYSGEGDVKEKTLEELMKMTVVRGSHVERFPNLKMCTLQEYVDICKQYHCHPIIEIKDPRPETMQSFYDFLVKNDLLKDAVIISFIAQDLKALHDIDASLTLWYLTNYLNDKAIEIAKDSGCCGIDFSSAFNLCRPEQIAKLHKEHLTAACWTVDDKKTLQAMLDAGVEYITTNSILPE